ncbi:hypothetical protein CVT24_008100 [Panaeolus cyanescens]|uniref:pyranose dehydrogenase (acceptor) n=1 Tax=Panaeolus cyanescens TaxID=181874 RepID=A0A409YLK4_9AGAR|nr:hypothetical protein CVT24_008100 [Panaeolus cyanescens]
MSTPLQPPHAQFDIIFAGGGPCACIAASRLLEHDNNLRILVIEYGSHVKFERRHIQPAQFVRLQTDPEVLHFHVGKPSPALGGRSPIVPTGKAAETYQEQDTNGTHGTSGPIKVSFAPDLTQVGDAFIDASIQYDKGRGKSDDINGFHECDVYGKWARYIDKETGRRSDVPHHYIYNKPETQNLTIMTQTIVDSVVIENGRAVGVKYQSLKTPGSSERVAHATKFVVLGVGAFGSPAILERSGIGSTKVLQQLNISQIVDLPGVGENYMDHIAVFPPYRGSQESETLDEIFYGTEEQFEHYERVWTKTGQGLMAHNSVDAGAKLRPNAQDLQEMSPEMDERWKNYYANAPDRPLLILGSMAGFLAGPSPSLEEKFFTVPFFPGHLASTGYTHIASRDPHIPTDFHPGYLDHPADLAVMRWGYKKSRELARRMRCYRGEVPAAHPNFNNGSPAAIIENDLPHSTDEPDICGTCAMKPRAHGGVVDERLNVYGVQGLKVADCSIFPGNVAANTYNTAIAIGEKAAVIIAEDLKL